ncbi:hypothetical protein X994_6555 (plasmid) [Burkholderia pseudomallei]|nr:hypothetical protein X994_6555 [Burkholderia pseudomallei]
MVVGLNPVGDRTVGLLQGFEALAMYALLLEEVSGAIQHRDAYPNFCARGIN